MASTSSSSLRAVLLFVLVAVESAGVPLPGETALIAAAVLAARGHYSIVDGDRGRGRRRDRRRQRRLLARPQGRPGAAGADPDRRATTSSELLPPAERFFERHGAKTVFIGRFVAVLRVTSAWLAGISHMPWWRFLFWNAAGGIVWAALVGVVAY